MNELIRVNYENERPTVLGRELYNFLEVGTAYKDWFPRMCEYGFEEGKDFSSFLSESTGGRPASDHQLTIQMAKEICMIQRNEKGKQARQYFIQIEESWNSPMMVMSRALKFANAEMDKLQVVVQIQSQQILELQPKATYYDSVLQTSSLMTTKQVALDYGTTAQKLNNSLHQLGVQYKQSGVWLLYSKYLGYGYTQTKIHTYIDSLGREQSKIHTYWTQKGRLFIYDLLKSQGVLPTIEREEIA